MIHILHVRQSILVLSMLASFTMVGGMTTTLTSQDQEASVQEDRVYVVTGIEIEYAKEIPGLPDPKSIFDVEINLSKVIDGWVGPDKPGEPTTIALGLIGREGPVNLYPSAILAIRAALGSAFPNTPLTVAPIEQDIDPVTGRDLRGPDRTMLRFKLAFEGPRYEISQFVLHYAIGDHPGQLPVEDVRRNVNVMLTRTEEGFVTWRQGVAPTPFRLTDLDGENVETFSAIAVQIILEGISDYLVEQGLMGVWARPAPGELGAGLSDARQDRTEFHIEMVTGYVSGVRTIAKGHRIDPDEAINHRFHEEIRNKSPIQPSLSERIEAASVLRRDDLDRYLYRLSRHPGRRVDAAIAPGIDPFSVNLDYHITENKPVMIYAQATNTGTDQTEEWRYRFGIFDNQFTGNDDILNLEYISADFEDNNAVTASYEAKLGDQDRWRWRAYGTWSEFDASEVGFANATFTGESWSVGAEIIWNFHQNRQLFFDLIAGVRYTQIDVNNPFAPSGDEDFFFPYVGVKAQKHMVESTLDVGITLEWNPDLTSVDSGSLDNLGRTFTDDDWVILRWDAVQSFFLEPLLNREAWQDISTPETSTLAHEIALRFRGQYAFDRRLIPQMEQVAGGFYSVRGYPESVAVGDTVILGTVEYRFHLPRAFGFEEKPAELFNAPFRIVPQQPFGAADWDLILRGFIDVGRTINSDRLVFEEDQTLVGVGVGLEFAFKTNLNVRVDWGVALEEIEGVVSSGSSQVHIVTSIFF